MHDCAFTLTDLGRHHEALELREQTVQFYQRALPPTHPNIGEVSPIVFAFIGSVTAWLQAAPCTTWAEHISSSIGTPKL
jgi:hypothetical protein